MSKNISLISGLLAALLFSTHAVALPYQSLSPRTLSMGGVGVASANEAEAGFLNPALLASARGSDGFNFVLPVLGWRFSDPDNLLDKVDTYQAAGLETNLTDAIVDYRELTNVVIIGDPDDVAEIKAAAQTIVDASQALLNQAGQISGRPLQAEFLSGMTITIPNKRVGASLVIDTRVVAGGVFEYRDQTLLQGIVVDGTTTANALIQEELDALELNAAVAGQLSFTDTVNAVDNLTSNLSARGAIVSELGLALAREVTVKGHDIAVGVTPKLVKVQTFHYVLGLDTARFDSDLGHREYTDFNIDVGVAKDFGNGWSSGLVIKDLLGKEYETRPYSSVSGLTPVASVVKIEPQVRLGVSHNAEWISVAADLDVTKNASAGFEPDSQYLGLGAEMNLLDLALIRVGYRHNLNDSDTSIPALGLGFSPLGMRVDMAIAGNGDETAYSLQLGFNF